MVISLAGGYCTEAPPVPIPNTAVKLSCAEDTWREAAWENRALPALERIVTFATILSLIYSSIAQSVEHAAVNRRVVGSSPTWGASPSFLGLFSFYSYKNRWLTI